MNQLAQDIPARRFSPQLKRSIHDDQFSIELLSIALDQLPKTKPLRRSQLARRDYVPDVQPVLPEPKKNRFKEFLRLFRPAVILILVALILFGAKAAHDWFEQNFAFGTLKSGPSAVRAADDIQTLPFSRDPAVALVQKQQFVNLPQLPIPWHWAMLPFSLAQDEQGRPSFWVKARNKGIVKGENDLPKIGEMGDEYFSADGTAAWIWMLPTGAQAPSWVDP
jgi:hypothetical protein